MEGKLSDRGTAIPIYLVVNHRTAAKVVTQEMKDGKGNKEQQME